MKKILCVCVAVALAAVFSSCAGYGYGNGFAYAGPGLILTDAYYGGYIQPKAESLKDVEVLGPVKGVSKSSSILGWVSTGDSSILAAKADALRNYPNADDIINIEVDSKVHSILGVISDVELHLRGIAIKYKK
ncbi:MAG: hypothetical protein GX902_10055 [Lentisphaerae bacterium]|nr:hypothetical protein [Lentisphaerota bacterium]